MTIAEAASAGVQWLWKPIWNPTARLRIDIYAGLPGPWGSLYDAEVQEIIGAPTPQRFPLVGDMGDDFEPADPPANV